MIHRLILPISLLTNLNVLVLVGEANELPAYLPVATSHNRQPIMPHQISTPHLELLYHRNTIVKTLLPAADTTPSYRIMIASTMMHMAELSYCSDI